MTYEYKGPKNMYLGEPKTIVIVSGYFNPWHKGHREYLQIAKGLGDKLWVIVNNDYQQRLKKGAILRDEKKRMSAVRRKKYMGKPLADEIILSIDENPSQCDTLDAIVINNPGNCYIFANGGDRHNGNIPEVPICKRHKIKMVQGCGAKIASSTDINIRLGLEKPK
jgi:cytidyltransferase-like protein